MFRILRSSRQCEACQNEHTVYTTIIENPTDANSVRQPAVEHLPTAALGNMVSLPQSATFVVTVTIPSSVPGFVVEPEKWVVDDVAWLNALAAMPYVQQPG